MNTRCRKHNLWMFCTTVNGNTSWICPTCDREELAALRSRLEQAARERDNLQEGIRAAIPIAQQRERDLREAARLLAELCDALAEVREAWALNRLADKHRAWLAVHPELLK